MFIYTYSGPTANMNFKEFLVIHWKLKVRILPHKQQVKEVLKYKNLAFFFY
jgi:hypothetical protein